jgi:hypothetical protein
VSPHLLGQLVPLPWVVPVTWLGMFGCLVYAVGFIGMVLDWRRGPLLCWTGIAAMAWALALA